MGPLTAAEAISAFWTVANNTSTLLGITDSIQGKIDHASEKQDALKLEQLCVEIDDIKFSEADTLRLECYCESFKTKITGGSLFAEEEKQQFIEEYFQQNSQFLPYRSELVPVLEKYIEALDTCLSNRITAGERLILKKLGEQKEQPFSTPTAVAPVIYTANSMYADAFGRILFLHDETNPSHANVTLANLYVKQRYMERKGKYDDLPARLAQFVQQDTERFLFIEGDAGSGKTTLVEWLNYYYRLNQKEATDILGTRSLVTIRLRDLNKNLISRENDLINAIRDYMSLSDQAALAEQLCKAVFILDGFDELCMIDQITDYTQLIHHFAKKLKRNLPAKIIITSRPKYIQALSFPHKTIALLHFNQTQRDTWLTKYKEDCKQAMAPHIEAYLQNIDEGRESAIFDTPMALYMIAARNPDESALTNSWRLYHTIFYEDIRNTEYNQMLVNPKNPLTDDTHPTSEQWDIYYQISEEIAYRMYKTQNSKLYVDSDDLREIINDLSQTCPELKDQTMQEITKNCHVLCCYWKSSTEDGVLEFYHNNIRDFFLCEKIYREVNRLYQRKIWDDRLTVLQFVELFQYYQFESQVCQFIRQRSECCKDRDVGFCRNDFPPVEYRHRHLPDFFQLMVTNGSLFLRTETSDKVFEGIRSANPVRSMSNVLNCVINLFDLAYLPHLKGKETFDFWNDIDSVRQNILLQNLLCVSGIRIYLQRVNLTGTDLTRADLSRANLTNANLNRAHLNKANLSRADLTGANLSSADLFSADLFSADLFSANLFGANLNGANLTRAHLNSADLTGADLIGANLTKAHLTGAHLTGAHLTKAYLNQADLTGAHLTRADLRCATLPDGFSSNNQVEQIEHLKSLHIEGLKI